MEIILIFPIASLAGIFAGGLILGGWWALALVFGIPHPTPDQTQGVLIGMIVICNVAVGGALVYAAAMDK